MDRTWGRFLRGPALGTHPVSFEKGALSLRLQKVYVVIRFWHGLMLSAFTSLSFAQFQRASRRVPEFR